MLVSSTLLFERRASAAMPQLLAVLVSDARSSVLALVGRTRERLSTDTRELPLVFIAGQLRLPTRIRFKRQRLSCEFTRGRAMVPWLRRSAHVWFGLVNDERSSTRMRLFFATASSSATARRDFGAQSTRWLTRLSSQA